MPIAHAPKSFYRPAERRGVKGLDLFCGAGGATRGYQDAGHTMTGIDWRPQPRYCGEEFLQADVMELIHDLEFLRQFDFVHASPPCQYFSSTARLGANAAGKVDLLTPVLHLVQTFYPDMRWVIENVPEAPLPGEETILMCGSRFPELVSPYDPRRQLRRHRKFWLQHITVPDWPPVHLDRFRSIRLSEICAHNGFRPLGVYGNLGDSVPGGGSTAGNMKEAMALMGIDWMLWRELREAIPPAYTRLIGAYIG